MDRLAIKSPSAAATRGRLLSSLLKRVPGAWVSPTSEELIALYRQRYRMAVADEKYDTALIFLNKILEIDPINIEAKFCKGEIYHRYLADLPRALEQYQRILRLNIGRADEHYTEMARNSMTEIIELLS